MEEKIEKKKSGFGVASLVLGIIAISTSFIVIINNMSFILGIIGIILGIISLAKKASKGKAISGIILCILAIVITLAFQKSVSDALDSLSNDLDNMTGNNSETILQNDADVQLGNFTATESYGMYDTNLSVVVKNKSSERKSFSIHIEATSTTGERLADDYVYANDLNAGQSQTFETFQLVSSDKVDALKNATFSIVDISTL